MSLGKSSKVMGFGTFDGLHPGHLFLFAELKKLGKKLTVVVARDQNVAKIKGRPPKRPEQDRLKAVANAPNVDEAILGEKNDFLKCIRDHQPNVIGLGYDQKADTEALESAFPHIRIVRISAFEPEKYKSSLMGGNFQ